MRRILLAISVLLCLQVQSQTLSDTGAVRSYVNQHITPNGQNLISANMLRTVFNGQLNALPGLLMNKIDSSYSSNDTLYWHNGYGWHHTKVAGGSAFLPFRNIVYDTSNLNIDLASDTLKFNAVPKNLNLDQVLAPSSPGAVLNSSAGNLNGSYLYQITYVTASGETEGGSGSSIVNPVNQKVNLTIPVSLDRRVIARRIYRNGSYFDNVVKQLVATINDNTTTAYTDNIANGSLGAYMPRLNTTAGEIYLGGQRIGSAASGSTVFGVGTMPTNRGYANTAIGFDALNANTFGYRNTAAGTFALFSNTTGYENTALGVHALNDNSTGNQLTALGYGALIKNTTGSGNTASGDYALGSNTIGSDNTATGNFALHLNDLGSSNTAFGTNAAKYTNSYSNSAFGASSLLSNVTGNFNTALGQGALSNSLGNANTSVGFQSLNTTTGGGNVAIGSQAGYYETGSNKFYVDNTSRANELDARAKALLYGQFDVFSTDNQFLNVNGHLYVNAKPVSNDSSSHAATTAWVKELLRNAGLITGSVDFGGGAVNYLAKWTNDGRLQNSSIADNALGVDISKNLSVTQQPGGVPGLRVLGTNNPAITVEDGTTSTIFESYSGIGSWIGSLTDDNVYFVRNNVRKLNLSGNNSFQPFNNHELDLGDPIHRYKRLHVDTVDATVYLNLPTTGSGTSTRTSTTVTSSTYTVALSVSVVFVNYLAGTAIVTLPDPASFLDREITIKNLTASNVSIQNMSVNDANTLTSYGAVTLHSDGSSWFAISKY